MARAEIGRLGTVMDWLRNISIKGKLILLVSAVTGLVLLLVVITLTARALGDVRREMVDDIALAARIFADAHDVSIAMGHEEILTEMLTGLRQDDTIVAGCIFDAEGQLTAAYQQDHANPVELPSSPEHAGHRFEEGRLIIYHPVVQDGQLIGTIYLHASREREQALLTRSHGTLALVLIAGLILAVLLSARLQTIISAPIRHLADVVQRVSTDKDYAVRAKPHGHDEVGLLISGFNGMIEVIQARERELQEHRAMLEDQVAERTSELLAVNHRLSREKERAEAATRAKSQFLANMSHEIRTPLNGVIGMTDMIMQTALSHEQKDYVRTVCDSAELLSSLIDDILDFSKIEAGKLTLESMSFSLRSALTTTVGAIALGAQRKGIEVICDIDPQVPDGLVGDVARLRQVLLNLLSNAAKFTEVGEIVTSVSVADEQEDSVRLRITIRDTGIGIPKSKQSEIFSAFSQADTSTTRRFGGTGLGLAICSQLVSLMGGEIGVHSAARAGSIFWIEVPFGKSTQVSVIEGSRERIEGIRALVVDRNDTMRRVLCKLLEGWGLEPEGAGDWRIALAAAESAARNGRPFQLALADARMTDEDPARLRELMAAPKGSSRILLRMLTPGTHASSRDCELWTAGIKKPITSSNLLDALLESLREDGQETAPLHATIAPPERSRSGPDLEETASPCRVLVVEDNLVNQKVARVVLEKSGFKVEIAADGLSAVDLLSTSAFDAILMDLHMPGMNGIDATLAIREHEQGSGERVPIIAMTANATADARRQCEESGMDGFLTKPIKPQEVVETLSSILERRKVPSNA